MLGLAKMLIENKVEDGRPLASQLSEAEALLNRANKIQPGFPITARYYRGLFQAREELQQATIPAAVDKITIKREKRKRVTASSCTTNSSDDSDDTNCGADVQNTKGGDSTATQSRDSTLLTSRSFLSAQQQRLLQQRSSPAKQPDSTVISNCPNL